MEQQMYDNYDDDKAQTFAQELCHQKTKKKSFTEKQKVEKR